MKTLLLTLRALWKTLLFSLIVLIGFVYWIRYDLSHGVQIMPLRWIILALGILLNIALIVVAAVAVKKEGPLNEILEQEGYSDAYIEKFRETYPNPTTAQKLRLTGILTTAKRYSEAEQMLAGIPTAGLTEDLRMEYHTCRMDLLFSTHRYSEAITELQGCRSFMDAYANAHPKRGIVHGLNAGVILAAANDYEGSEHYLRAAEHFISEQKGMSPCLAQIARVIQLYLLGFPDRARQCAEETRTAIMQDPVLKQGWQKQHFLEKLEDAKSYEREIL